MKALRPERLWFCDHYDIPLPPGHKFPLRKYRLLRDALEADGAWRIDPATLAPVEAIARVHEAEYIERFLAGTLDRQVMRRIGFPWSASMTKRTLASVGGTLLATQDAVTRGFGGVLAGGTHHAFRAEGAGFCVFNDIAIAIADLRARGQARRIAVIDLDVHQGDGTAQLFECDPDVFTLSLHGAANFPFRKQTSTLDVALANGTGDAEYLAALHGALRHVVAWQPEFVFYQGGVDPLLHDALGKLKLTFEGLLERDETVFTLCQDEGWPVVMTLGGGYADPIDLTVRAHANTFRLAWRLWHGAA